MGAVSEIPRALPIVAKFWAFNFAMKFLLAQGLRSRGCLPVAVHV